MTKAKIPAALLLALCLASAAAHAEVTYIGTVIAGETLSVAAPFSGTVTSLPLRVGEWVEAGRPVAVLAAQRVYAELDGTIRGLNKGVGESAEGVLCYISPVRKYTISASVEDAYNSPDTTYVYVGETVYISCAADGSHRAVGVITAVSGLRFTVETTRGELYMEERVNLYRSEGYEASTRVGCGTVSRTAEVAVSGTGTLVALHVADGEEVERGQLLFETVPDAEADGDFTSGEVLSPVSGAITELQARVGASAAAGDSLLTVAPRERYQVTFSVPESALASVRAGGKVTLMFCQDEEHPRYFAGTIDSLSYLGQTSPDTNEITYEVCVSFDADASVRLGMSASVLLEE